MTEGKRSAAKYGLAAAIAAGVTIGGGALVALKPVLMPPAAIAQQPSSLATEIALVRQEMTALTQRLDALNQRLSHLEGVWDARRTMPAADRR